MSGRILLIDDDDSLRRVTEYNLIGAGFEVVPLPRPRGAGPLRRARP